MKPMIAIRLLGSLAFVLGTAVPVGAQEPATDFTGWLCEIDLTFPDSEYPNPNLPPGVRDRVPPSVFTNNTRKHCPANPAAESITIECRTEEGKPIPGWTGSASTHQDVPCSFNGDQCGVPGFHNSTDEPSSFDTTLNIDGSGNARLFCKFNPP